MSVASTSLIAMPARWSADRVLDLAPDESSRRSAGALGRPAPWQGAGVAGDVLWGLCAGSGKNPYQVVVDLSGPAYKCSCPSRKFPCKHALGLLLNWANGALPEESAPADFAAAWLAERRARAEKAEKSVVRTVPGDSPTSPAPGTVKDEAAAARRVQQRAQRVANGLAELQSWLRDQVLVGLSATPGPAERVTREIAARMVDAQAPGVAAVLRGLSEVPGSGEGWPGRLLGEYAQLHLLARAHQRLGDLPPDLAATVRSRVGYPTSRQDVLARPPVTDHWTVLGVRDLLDGQVPGRRLWLRGRDSGRWAMLLTFAAPRPGGRGRRLAGPGHGPAPARDRAAREPALLPRPARAARDRGGAARRAGPVGVPAGRRRRRRPAGRLRRRP